MSIRFDKYLKQTLVYWEKSGVDGSGASAFRLAVELACRWDDRIEEVQLSDARRVISKAHLLTPYLLKVGSIVFKGTLAAWRLLPTYPRIPTTAQGGFELFLAYATPDIRGRDLAFEARL